jgi:hypothetical protein
MSNALIPEGPGILPEKVMDMPKDETIRNLLMSVVTKAPREAKNVMEKQDDSFRNLVFSFGTSLALVASLPFILPKIEEGTLYTNLVPAPIRARLEQQFDPVKATGKIATSTTPYKALEVKKKVPSSSVKSTASQAPAAPETAAEETPAPLPIPNNLALPSPAATPEVVVEEEATPKELTQEEVQKEEARKEELRKQEARRLVARQLEEAQKEEARILEAETRLRQAVPTVAPAVSPQPIPVVEPIKVKPLERAAGQEEFQTFEDIMKMQSQK